MAARKKDDPTFFLRLAVSVANDGNFDQTEFDLGSYTSLGSSKPEVLKIHAGHAYITDSGGEFPVVAADSGGSLSYQLTTQSQTGLVTAEDDTFILGGTGAYRNPDSAALPPTQEAGVGIMPQDYVDGYMVATPSLFLGGQISNQFNETVKICVVLECSTMALNKEDAIAIALNQS
tara:strand:+ start:533 stop:1060 length:528 start_codon:yes stop_codon:yes gene_type:complete